MRLIIIFSLFFWSACFSQQKNSELQVSYQLYINGEWSFTYPAVLYVKDSVTIYQAKPRLREKWVGGKVNSESDPYILTAKNIEDDYLRINHRNKEILFFDRLPTVSMLVTDNYPQFSWNISSETKNIAGYQCKKAVASFRGREWTAWFTMDIPVPYGPWKLNGLPGLILEAHDNNDTYTIRALKVDFDDNKIFNSDFKTLIPAYNKKPVTYKQFLVDRTEAFENIAKKMSTNGRNMVFKETPRNGMELKYEWE
jgi:GLPGLI family protein